MLLLAKFIGVCAKVKLVAPCQGFVFTPLEDGVTDVTVPKREIILEDFQ